jgi:mannose-1-phosphate guanylyltransferase/mannose-6-phosphate isomerase
MRMILQPVILCGGSGTRLWPLSREQYPKQLLKLVGDHTMLQATALRLFGLPLEKGDTLAAPLLVGNDEYRFLIAQQLKEVGIEHALLVLEPCGRNTALTLAARAGKLVTFGIRPSAPETGYGYIKLGSSAAGEGDGEGTALVERFVEKPDLATAEHYLASGQYLWNGGIFVMQASTWLAKIEETRPDIAAAMLKAFEGRSQDRDFLRPDAKAFAASPADSIDYAVLEKLASASHNSGEVAVVPLDAKWSDLGAWNALWEIGQQDENHNVLMGDVLAIETRNTLAIAQGRLVACVGLENIVVVETPDAILVADKSQIQHVKELVAKLKLDHRNESSAHRKVYRPWGCYDSIDSGPRFQVKRIVSTPAQRSVYRCTTTTPNTGSSSRLQTDNGSSLIRRRLLDGSNESSNSEASPRAMTNSSRSHCRSATSIVHLSILVENTP